MRNGCVLGCALLFFVAATATAQVATGVWAKTPGTGDGTLQEFSWRIEDASTGALVVLPSVPSTVPTTFRFEFTEKFVQTRMSTSTRTQSGEVMALECSLQPQKVRCASDFNGTKGSAELDVSGPTVFLLEDYSGTSLPWLLMSMAAQASRTPGETTAVTVVSLGDTAGDRVSLEKEVDKIRYFGKEKVALPIGTFNANLFEFNGQKMWIADSGLLLALAIDEASHSRLQLTKLADPKHRFSPK